MRDNYSFGAGRALAATRFCGGPNAPDWEHVQTVDTATRATLKLSKDNVIFGVRAVDSAGHRSLPVMPEPERS